MKNNFKRPKQLARTTIYESKWINLHVDQVELPGGRIVKKMHVLDYPMEGVGVVVVNESGKILLEYAYRYHTGKDGWEIPTGGIDPGESVLVAARREVQEETGYQTKDDAVVYSYNPSNGSSNQVLHIVFSSLSPEEQKPFDTNEVREIKWVTEDEVWELIHSKEMVDGFSLVGLLLYLSGRKPAIV